MLTLTLTPNRSNPPWFAKLLTYERKGNRVTKLLKRYNSGKCTGAKVAPFDRRDWTHVPSNHYTVVPDLQGPAYSAEDYANDVPLPAEPKVTREVKRCKVYHTAKRDWLAAMGVLHEGVSEAQYGLEWVPGTAYFLPLEVEDADDIAIHGGHFRLTWR